jgi:hypothetical protein
VRSDGRVRLLTRKGIYLAIRFPVAAAAALAFNPLIPFDQFPALLSLLASACGDVEQAVAQKGRHGVGPEGGIRERGIRAANPQHHNLSPAPAFRCCQKAAGA